VPVIPFILLGLVIALLIGERWYVSRVGRTIPLRIHVNGSRGKSSIVRYIVAGLRAGGKRTLGKITGVRPTLLLPDGTAEELRRRGPANIREQISVLRQAKAFNCHALVLECMSIAAPLQQIEGVLLRPHVSVLTNILDDHLEELGESDATRVEAYCSSLPANSIIVTTDNAHIKEIQQAANQRGSSVLLPPESIRGELPASVSPIEREHIRLAVAVCKKCGVEESQAIEGILGEITNDISLAYSLPVKQNTVDFVNGFAVNDITSAALFLEIWKNKLNIRDNLIILLNTRADRPKRSDQFARWCSERNDVHSVVVTGTHAPYTRRKLLSNGMKPERVRTWSDDDVRNPLEAFGMMVKDEATVFGFGNIAGDGFRILDALQPYRQRQDRQW